MIEIMLVWIKI